jgi:hypothetical protein
MDRNQNFWHNFFSALFLVLVGLATMYFNLLGHLPNKISVFDFVILSLATFRLIRLFVYDSVTSHVREYLGRYEHGPRKELSMLINCPWCVGIWMAFFTSFIYFLTPLSWYFILLLALAGVGSALQVIMWKVGRTD